ncbi:hypothetical protein PspLS_00298 [Pyricularia sp. CBS 133598]|nr:hypothetical protein PspLS_00298 [Pyricularia sp. CBS 133598]
MHLSTVWQILALFTAVASSAPTSHAAVRARHVNPPEADIVHVVKRGHETDFSNWQEYELWDAARVQALREDPALKSRYSYRCNTCGSKGMDDWENEILHTHPSFWHYSPSALPPPRHQRATIITLTTTTTTNTTTTTTTTIITTTITITPP